MAGKARYTIMIPKQDDLGNQLNDLAATAHHHMFYGPVKTQGSWIERDKVGHWHDGPAEPYDHLVTVAEDRPEVDSHIKQLAAGLGGLANRKAIYTLKENKDGINDQIIDNPNYARTSASDLALVDPRQAIKRPPLTDTLRIAVLDHFDPDLSKYHSAKQWQINVGRVLAPTLQHWMLKHHPEVPFQLLQGRGGWDNETEPSAALHLYTEHPQAGHVLGTLGRDFPAEQSFGVIPQGHESTLYENPYHPDNQGQMRLDDPGDQLSLISQRVVSQWVVVPRRRLVRNGSVRLLLDARQLRKLGFGLLYST